VAAREPARRSPCQGRPLSAALPRRRLALAPDSSGERLDRAAWPTEWGGTGWNVVQRYIFEEECGYAGAPTLSPFGLAMCAPILIRFGTQAQKERFLPRIYRGDDFWCQGYSEPGSGSDLASLRTRAVRKGDRYVVDGQKIWTTAAHVADWIFCLVRTGGPPSDGRTASRSC
jgi:alkylation response protein AidB-like acyl-CoA dehydrogenase